ncbi:MAG TPA: plastocyanin/azurin family copper-binding protein [Thermoplasmata archaeon]|nr:plastocyanin/azurin family copper-binding protein [Thermoplasmata archaeon]
MRSFALIVATSLLLLAAVPIFGSPVVQAVPIPRFALTILGETNGTKQQFSQTLIAVSVVPIELSVTFHNNDTMGHSFTIDDVNQTPHRIDTGTLGPGQTKFLNFTVLSMTRILYNGTTFTPEVAPQGGILFFCIPHRGAGMVGRIAMAGVTTAPSGEKGILLRAYWIGIIGIAATLLWTIISYFVIKSSSRHFRDHSEHVRRGGP